MKKLLSLILSLAVIFTGILPVSMVSASAGTDATLKDICFENHSVFGFDSNTFIYQDIEQPYRFSKTGDNYPRPAVSVTTTDPNATADITVAANAEKANSWNITITVTAADGVTKKVYSLYTKPVGQNLYEYPVKIVDAGVEDGLTTGYVAEELSNTANLEATTEEAYTGNYSLKLPLKSTMDFPSPNFPAGNWFNVIMFNSYAVKSSSGMYDKNDAYNVNPTYIFVDSQGTTLKTQADTTSGRTRGSLDAEDANGWQLSMRISKAGSSGQTGAQGGATSDTSNTVAYYDEFYMGPLVISEIKVSGDTYAKLGETSTLNYSAKLLNQYGNEGGLKGELTDGNKETVTWKLVNAPKDVSINESTGVVTVADTVTETGDFYVEAQVTNSTFNVSGVGVESSSLLYCQTQMGGRIKVSLLPENSEAALSDITVNGGGIEGFTSDVKEYDIYVPYSYSANNFTFARPVVSATPIMEGADVEITYPATIADGEKIYIDVEDLSGNLSARYTLTINTVGENRFPDGGFETSAKTAYQTGNNGPITWDVVEDNTGAGSKLLKANAYYDSNGFSAALRTVAATYLAPGKTYINGYMVKLDPETANQNTSFRAGVVAGYDDAVKKREQFAGDYFKLSTGENVAKALTLTNDWETYTAVVSSTRDADVRIGVSMGSTDKTATYFLLDDMYLGELVIADVDLTNASGQTASEAQQGDAVALTVTAKNQYGNTQGITHNVAYEVINGYQGLTFDGNTVTVADDAAAGTAVIEATVTPTYTGAAQPYVKKRIALTILPEDGFTYSKDTISAGDVATTLNYTAQENVNLMFVNALYEIVNGALVFKDCITDNTISLIAGQRVSKDLTLTVPQTGTYCIKSYLFEKETLKPIFDTVGSLGQ